MTPQDFCFWLQGFLEISESPGITEKQTSIIKDHLKLVFQDKTPKIEGRRPQTLQILDHQVPKSFC